MERELGVEEESEKQKVPLTIRLPRKTYRRIKEMAEANDLPLAEVGRRLIHRCMEDFGFEPKEEKEVDE
ncbi:MAG: hypothetical protein ABEK04_03100 [Candidatus Nanohalobium sp.]